MNIGIIWLFTTLFASEEKESNFYIDATRKSVIDSISTSFENMFDHWRCISIRKCPQEDEKKEMIFIELCQDFSFFKMNFANSDHDDKEVFDVPFRNMMNCEGVVESIFRELDKTARKGNFYVYFCFCDKVKLELRSIDYENISKFIKMFKSKYGASCTITYVPYGFRILASMRKFKERVEKHEWKVILEPNDEESSSWSIYGYADLKIFCYDDYDALTPTYKRVKQVLEEDYTHRMIMLSKKCRRKNLLHLSPSDKYDLFLCTVLDKLDQNSFSDLKIISDNFLKDFWKYLRSKKSLPNHFEKSLSQLDRLSQDIIQRKFKEFIDEHHSFMIYNCLQRVLKQENNFDDYISTLDAIFLYGDAKIQKDAMSFIDMILHCLKADLYKVITSGESSSEHPFNQLSQNLDSMSLEYWKNWINKCHKYILSAKYRKGRIFRKDEVKMFEIIKKKCDKRYSSSAERCIMTYDSFEELIKRFKDNGDKRNQSK